MISETILIVDDDEELCALVSRYLRREGFEVAAVHDGLAGVEQALSGNFALVILDVMLPGQNGLDALRQLRRQSLVPVIMLTARGDDVDRIVGLEIGADDYLPKPFNPHELVARIRAILRRSAAVKDAPEILREGDLELDGGARTVRCAGEPVALTGAEFDLLALLLRRAGQVVPREELVQTVLGRPLLGYDRSIDTLVSNLRRKLGAHPDDAERLRAVRGVGYVYTRSRETP